MKLDFAKLQRQVTEFFRKQPRYILYGAGLILFGLILIIIGFIIL